MKNEKMGSRTSSTEDENSQDLEAAINILFILFIFVIAGALTSLIVRFIAYLISFLL